MAEETKKKIGRPKKKTPPVEEIVDEKNTDKLEMSKKDTIVSVSDLTKEWKNTFTKIAVYDSLNVNKEYKSGISTVTTQWNKLNPFLQNQRIKNLYTQARTLNKQDLGMMAADPANHEAALRSAAWANSSSQQIYYNILRRSCDIPEYKHFLIPENLEAEEYKKDAFKKEDKLINDWIDLFNIPNTFKTIALQVKREGKQSYLLRNKFDGEGASRTPAFCTLQKMPSDWIKITGMGQLGFTISFNMMYFLNIANSPSDFGEFIEQAWEDINKSGVIYKDEKTEVLTLETGKAATYKFTYKGETYSSMLESLPGKKGIPTYMFWLRMPFDICYTFGSDNSAPWVAPDTMGLLQKLQELSDYGQLAGLIASTPLTAVLTGELETITNPGAGRNESVFSPEVVKGYQELFNSATSTNVEAWMWPAKNIKLQQLNSDVNSSEILSSATENFVEMAGEGGLTITTSKPNVSQVKTAQKLAASQQRYVTLQFENVMNYILQHKLGFKYRWKIRIWGDIFSFEDEKSYLKELVISGATFLFPKLASAEDINLRDTKAMTEYVKTFDFYKDFKALTEESKMNQQKVGRPSLPDGQIENDATAKSRDDGTNTSDNRDTLSRKCPICGKGIEEGMIVCEECAEKILENYGE